MSSHGAFIAWALFALGMLGLAFGAVGVWLLVGWVKRLALAARIVAGRLEHIERALVPLVPGPAWRTFAEEQAGEPGRVYLGTPARRPTRPTPDDTRS